MNTQVESPSAGSLQAIYEVALKAAKAGGAIAVELRNSLNFTVKHKDINHPVSRDLVTEADRQSEAAIIAIIRSHFPTHRFLAEESFADIPEEDLRTESLWVIDPIDGTTNFAHGLPHVGISVAYVERGVTKVGVVEAPFLGESYGAINGQGATLNGRPLKVTKKNDLGSLLVATGFPYDRSDLAPIVQRVERVLAHCRDIRRLGACSIDICYVAAGRLDAYYEHVQPWDMAAAALIAKEAGARVGQYQSTEKDILIPEDLRSDALLVTNPEIYQALCDLLNR